MAIRKRGKKLENPYISSLFDSKLHLLALHASSSDENRKDIRTKIACSHIQIGDKTIKVKNLIHHLLN